MKKIILSIISLLCLSSVAWSQALVYSKIDQDPSSAAMGGASLSGRSSFGWTSHSNPAMMSFAQTAVDVSASYQNWSPSATNYINFGAFGKTGDKISLSGGAVYGSSKSFPVYDENGQAVGSFSPSDLMAGAALSYRVNKVLSAGASVSYVSQNVAKGQSYSAVSSNISVAAVVSDFIVTVAMKSLGTQVESMSEDKYAQALSIGAGALYTKNLSKESKIQAVLEADFFTAGEFSAALGASYTYNDIVSVRAGYHLGDKIMPSYASAGLGVELFGAHFDVAYLLGAKNTTPGGSIICGIGYSF